MKRLVLAMAFFYALLLPCFSQKEKEAYRYLENKISEETEMEFIEIRALRTLLFNGELFIVTFLDT